MNRLGTQESMAMLPRTRGPSMKPVWAATNRIAPSESEDDPEEPDPQRKTANLPRPDERLEERGVQGFAGDMLDVVRR